MALRRRAIPGIGSLKTQTKTVEEQFAEAMVIAHKDLVSFRLTVLPTTPDDVDPARYHYEWSEKLLHGTKNYAIEAFRESAKTQYVLRSFLLYCIVFPDIARDYIVLIKKNTRLAQAKLREIETEYDSNPIIKANVLKVRERSSEVFSVDVKGPDGKPINIRIEAYGKGSSIRGLAHIDRRPKLVLIDDPQDEKEISSEVMQTADWNWFLGDVMFLGQYCRTFLIGNNLGEKCIIERIAADPEALNFEFERLAIADQAIETPTWPSKYTVEQIKKERENYRRLGKIDIWMRERMCIAIADETRLFRKEDFNYYNINTAPKILAESNVILLVDPAASLTDSSDYRALVALAITPDNLWFILEVSYGRFDTMKLIEEMFRMSQQWHS